jgi:homoserine dehydrogenase
VLAHVAEQLAAQGVSVARLAQRQLDDGASLDLVTHEASSGRVEAALATVAELPEVRGTPTLMRVISERGV